MLEKTVFLLVEVVVVTAMEVVEVFVQAVMMGVYNLYLT